MPTGHRTPDKGQDSRTPARTGHRTADPDAGQPDSRTAPDSPGHLASDDRQLTGTLVADKLGITPVTWRSYKKRPPKGNPIPKPDGWHDLRTPWWWESTIDAWQARRPGAGARTDLQPKNDTPT